MSSNRCQDICGTAPAPDVCRYCVFRQGVIRDALPDSRPKGSRNKYFQEYNQKNKEKRVSKQKEWEERHRDERLAYKRKKMKELRSRRKEP